MVFWNFGRGYWMAEPMIFSCNRGVKGASTSFIRRIRARED
jgi:hypothetical protein